MIKAPYNFIPLSEQVVFPDWADRISHDVPFSDGISGTIDVSLTAETPIFVRNGHTRSDQENQSGEYASFSHIGGRYFLPGSSVKGAIRNVLEILSFGKMDVDPNARFAQREWDNEKLYPLKKEVLKLRCGWLREKPEGGYEIVDCGRPYRIGQKEIDAYLGSNIFEKEFSKKSNQEDHRDLNKERKIGNEEINPKTAYYKYRLVENLCDITDLENLRFSLTGSNDVRVGVDPDGDIEGTIVLTGQPDLWMYPRPKTLSNNAGKYYEFVFRLPASNSEKYSLSEEEFEQYRFMYSDSVDWKYLNDTLFPRIGIPVFFRRDEKTRKIRDWGLALLYKLPYERTPRQTLPEAHKEEKHDMTECIFGFTGKRESLKGRIQFSPFFSDNAEPDTRQHRLVLSGPKASYYPIYIDQKGREKGKGAMIGPNQYRTYNDGGLSGWKRYLQRANIWEKETGSDKIDSILHPVLPGAEFKGSVRFHNLRPEELGALLSALTFHGNEAECRHQFGMAKPYGYGKTGVKVEGMKLWSVGAAEDDTLLDADGYMAVFEKYMDSSLHRPWIKSAPVTELLTVARFDVTDNKDFDYMTLDMDGHNEFSMAKGGKKQSEFTCEYLQRYSRLIKKSYDPDSMEEKAADSVRILSGQRSAHQNDLRRLQEEEAVKAKALEAERALQEKERIEEEQLKERERKEAEQAAKQAERLANGLAFLDEIYEVGPNAGKYKIDEFKKLRPRVLDYLKKTLKTDRVPEEDYDILEKTLVRLATNPSKDEKRKNLWTSRTSTIWTFIENVTSKEFADRVFETIQKLLNDAN